VAQDQCLRETTDPSSPCIPPFHHTQSSRQGINQLNVFLVIINAEIKFQHYFQMVHEDPPITPLAEDVLSLMHRTIDLVKLIYWRPLPRKGTEGYKILAEIQQAYLINTGLSKELDVEDNDNLVLTQTSVRTLARSYSRIEHLLDGDLEEQRDNISALMSAHCMYPSLFLSSILLFTWFWSRC
jgi:hypothetical protein